MSAKCGVVSGQYVRQVVESAGNMSAKWCSQLTICPPSGRVSGQYVRNCVGQIVVSVAERKCRGDCYFVLFAGLLGNMGIRYVYTVILVMNTGIMETVISR